jgi:type IV pilus assembly protein PilM
MFKRNRDNEKINLLDTDLGTTIKRASSGAGNETAGTIALLACVLGAAVITGGIWGVMSLYDLSVKSDVKEIVSYIEDPNTTKQLNHREKLLGIRDNVNAYHTKMVNAHDAFYSQPVIVGDKFENIQLVLDKTAEELGLGESVATFPSYSGGTMSFSVTSPLGYGSLARVSIVDFSANSLGMSASATPYIQASARANSLVMASLRSNPLSSHT